MKGTKHKAVHAKTQRARSLSWLPLLLCVQLVSSCGGGIQNSINPAGPQADNLSRLWWLMFTVCSVVFVIVMIVLLLSLRNRTKESISELPPQVEPPQNQERRRRNVVISAATVTVVVLFVFLIASFSAGRSR